MRGPEKNLPWTWFKYRNWGIRGMRLIVQQMPQCLRTPVRLQARHVGQIHVGHIHSWQIPAACQQLPRFCERLACTGKSDLLQPGSASVAPRPISPWWKAAGPAGTVVFQSADRAPCDRQNAIWAGQEGRGRQFRGASAAGRRDGNRPH